LSLEFVLFPRHGRPGRLPPSAALTKRCVERAAGVLQPPEHDRAQVAGLPEALPVLQRAVERHSGIGLHALERHERAETPFDYDLPGALDPVLEMRLTDLAVRIYEKLEVKDFARVDFRVDHRNKPWFIEINPLPTFAPDGTFAIIAELAGRSYPEFLAEVLERALARITT
jgi:D-alanine-D-alanine ligase